MLNFLRGGVPAATDDRKEGVVVSGPPALATAVPVDVDSDRGEIGHAAIKNTTSGELAGQTAGKLAATIDPGDINIEKSASKMGWVAKGNPSSTKFTPRWCHLQGDTVTYYAREVSKCSQTLKFHGYFTHSQFAYFGNVHLWL